MGVFFAYSLKSAICLILFYLFYKVLLSKDTFHRFNRIALISVIILAVGIPFISLLLSQITTPGKLPQVTIPITEMATTLSLDNMPEENSTFNYIPFALLLIYIGGCLFCLLRCLYGLLRITRIIRKGTCAYTNNTIKTIIHNNERIAPFSWMKHIVISQKDMDEAGEVILLHEQAHIRLRHTIDLFLSECCLIFQWYNPAAWLLYRELQTIHEFEADEFVLNQGIDAKQYQLLLIKKAVGTRLYSMANSFNHSNLKKRITMMLQKKSSPWGRLKYAYILPLAAITVAAFARSEISQPFDEISSVKVNHFLEIIHSVETDNQTEIAHQVENSTQTESVMLAISEMAIDVATEKDISTEAARTTESSPQPVERTNESAMSISAAPEDTTVYNVADHMPEFPGGIDELFKFLADNTNYPASMQNSGIQGRVFISFIVTKKGDLRNLKVVQSLHPEADAEAIRVVNAMPKWKPGKLDGKVVNVNYTLPFSFKLSPMN